MNTKSRFFFVIAGICLLVSSCTSRKNIIITPPDAKQSNHQKKVYVIKGNLFNFDISVKSLDTSLFDKYGISFLDTSVQPEYPSDYIPACNCHISHR